MNILTELFWAEGFRPKSYIGRGWGRLGGCVCQFSIIRGGEKISINFLNGGITDFIDNYPDLGCCGHSNVGLFRPYKGGGWLPSLINGWGV